MNYVEITYKNHDYTSYPYKLIDYLFKRYHLKEGHNLLDIGCGRGEFSKAFQTKQLKVTSIDRIYNEDYHKDLNFYKFDLEKPIKIKSTFDIIFCKSVLEHIVNQEIFMNSIKNLMSKNGLIIMLVPDWDNQKNIFYDDPTHIHPYNQKSMKDLLEIYGFKNVQSEKFYQLPLVWKYYMFKILCKSIGLILKPEHYLKNKTLHWAVENMILATGRK
ncbi:MAG: class I SAM-dependent methyltransferase [Candidatus Nanoarchaeia archaeon]|jgi:2-polyprenyl-3-methyl-5-hydroxy-6-metoxy-1,4-benzoquinol methylase|nr:class I SAM-dependent methyltransferase [Candidatus Nanoarchaeia archaeon]